MKVIDKHIFHCTLNNRMGHKFAFISFDNSSNLPFFINVTKHISIEQAQDLCETIFEMIKKNKERENGE